MRNHGFDTSEKLIRFTRAFIVRESPTRTLAVPQLPLHRSACRKRHSTSCFAVFGGRALSGRARVGR